MNITNMLLTGIPNAPLTSSINLVLIPSLVGENEWKKKEKIEWMALKGIQEYRKTITDLN